METVKWKKDKTPYLIFKCNKCKQYLYVKTTQKTKKCLRCGYLHIVKKILNFGEIRNGITVAMKYVIKKQNELAISKLGKEPDLRTINDFYIASKLSDNSKSKLPVSKKSNIQRFDKFFKNLLIKLSKMYKEFPGYMIEIMAEEFKIPKNELKFLINKFRNSRFLIPLKNNYYKINTK